MAMVLSLCWAPVSTIHGSSILRESTMLDGEADSVNERALVRLGFNNTHASSPSLLASDFSVSYDTA